MEQTVVAPPWRWFLVGHEESPLAIGQSGRLPYLWLALAVTLMPFATAHWIIALAAWLYPVFLLRFARVQPVRRGISLVFTATGLVLAVALAYFSFSGFFFALLVVGMAVVYTLPYLIDRVLAHRLKGIPGTLVFPLATTTVWYLFSLSQGTWSNPANTQFGNLPLLQLLSVTGVWGVVFLMSWLAPVVCLAWERGFSSREVQRSIALYAAMLGFVLLMGGLRLALFLPRGAPFGLQGSARRAR